MPLRGAVEIAPGLSIGMHDRQRDLVHRPAELLRQSGKIGGVGGGIESRPEHDGIVSPHRDALPEPAAQLAQLRDPLLRPDDRAFQRARIAGQRELHGERRDLSHPVEIAQQRPHVAGPEHKTVDVSRRQRDPVRAAAIRVPDAAISGLEPGKKPGCVERRYVGAIACRNDHRNSAFQTQTGGRLRL